VQVPELTPREREYLRWTLRGKTAWETGVILGTSKHTAAKMLRSATSKLGANNKCAAAFKAFQLGLISYEDDDERTPSQSAQTGRRPQHASVPDVDSWPCVWLSLEDISELTLQHDDTSQLPMPVDAGIGAATTYGCTTWSAQTRSGRVGIQWNWVETDGIVVMENPMALVSNAAMRLRCQVPTFESSLMLHLLSTINQLPWQEDVLKVLSRNLRGASGSVAK